MAINVQNLFKPLLGYLIHLFYFHRHLRLLVHRYCKECVLFLVSSVLGFLILPMFGFPMSSWTTWRQLFAQFRLLQLLALDFYHAKLLPLLLPKVCSYRYVMVQPLSTRGSDPITYRCHYFSVSMLLTISLIVILNGFNFHCIFIL